MVFTKILRYLAFHHVPSLPNSNLDSFNLHQDSTNSSGQKNSTKTSNLSKDNSRSYQVMYEVPYNEPLTPKKMMRNDDYLSPNK